MGHELARFWAYIGGNVTAQPVIDIASLIVLAVFLKPAKAFWHKHFGAKDALADIRKIAEEGKQIAADTYRHHTGKDHELA